MHRWKDARFWSLLLGGILALAHAFAEVPLWLDMTFFAVFVLLLGIPHGAIDHLIEEQYLSKNARPFSLFRFLAKYLIQMAAYGILWIFFPSLSLLLFLVLSAWHFGESDMQPAPKHILWKISQAILGLTVLFFILLREPGLSGDLIFRITRNHELSLQIWQLASQYAWVIVGLLLAGLFVIGLFAQSRESLKWRKDKWVYFILLIFVINFLPLLPAFALYFGGWHALNTFSHMADFLQKKEVGKLWKMSMPFTLLAMFFLGISAAVWQLAFAHLDPLPVIFIFIAIITLPHMLVMRKMFYL